MEKRKREAYVIEDAGYMSHNLSCRTNSPDTQVFYMLWDSKPERSILVGKYKIQPHAWEERTS
jgi:hypothetical protein